MSLLTRTELDAARDRAASIRRQMIALQEELEQWHNDYDSEHAARMGDYFASFGIDEARGLDFTLEDLRARRPTETKRRRGGRGW